MPNTKKFSEEDIGAELLRVITAGLYRDPLDTLREYVQNAIDASAKTVEISISSDMVMLEDDGHGMDPAAAQRAIRLGLSEKNPVEHVGFRGIGIYSAFNTCGRLEIRTRPHRGRPSRIVFDFAAMKERFRREEQAALKKTASSLHLQELLTGAVWVEPDTEPPRSRPGTLVMLLGISGDVYQRLTNRKAVKEYLQNVVPLPFRPDFSHKREIELHFAKMQHRVIDLTLSTGGGSPEQLYRPYADDVFYHRRGMGPKFYRLVGPIGGEKLGFTWVCLNDARKYLSSKSMRGLLIKKAGFSVGGREQFAKYFSRAVFNNRVTGEVIITHPGLIPNAARSDFEPGQLRDAAHGAFASVAGKISGWAEKQQNELKAKEELESIAPEVFRMAQKIPEIERDVPELLSLNTRLNAFDRRLNTHRRMLRDLDPNLLASTDQALKEALGVIADILTESKSKKSKRRSRIVQAQRIGSKAPKQDELPYAKDRPKTLVAVASVFDMEMSSETRLLLRYLDDEVLKDRLSQQEYEEFLEDLLAYLDGAL